MDTLGSAGTGPTRLEKPGVWTKREREGSSTQCLPPGMRPEGGNLGRGAHRARSEGAACPGSMGDSGSVTTGERPWEEHGGPSHRAGVAGPGGAGSGESSDPAAPQSPPAPQGTEPSPAGQ